MFAAEGGNLKILELLLDRGLDVHDQTENGWTALMSAVQGGNLEMIKWLVEKGVDINAKYGEWTALGLAKIRGRDDAVQYLKEHGAK